MLGTRIGLKEDVVARLNRGHHSWSKVKQWLWKFNLGKTTRAIIVHCVVESTLLCENNTRAWTKGAVCRLQSMVDNATDTCGLTAEDNHSAEWKNSGLIRMR